MPIAENQRNTIGKRVFYSKILLPVSGGAAALETAREITPGICVKYERRLQALTSTLQELGFTARMPEGSFYLYADVPRGTASGITFASGEDFSQWLIREKLISTVPWDDAGACVRFSATFEAAGREEETRVLHEVNNHLHSRWLARRSRKLAPGGSASGGERKKPHRFMEFTFNP